MINDIMTYSIELRKRVVGFVNEGGSGKTSPPRLMVREIAKKIKRHCADTYNFILMLY